MNPYQTGICRRALDTLGINSQRNQTFEEMSELQQALAKDYRGKGDTVNIAEEIADVEIMLEQMKQHYKIQDLVHCFIDFKTRRLEVALKEGTLCIK